MLLADEAFVIPAPWSERCCMGYPLGDDHQCWNYEPVDLWCSACRYWLLGGPPCTCPGCSLHDGSETP